MNEPCTRCPPFVVRCGHLGEDWVAIRKESRGYLLVFYPPEGSLSGFGFATRAEADAEFTRRECALLESAALLEPA